MNQASEENCPSGVKSVRQFIVASGAALSWFAIALPAAADVIPNGLGTTVPEAEQICTVTCNINNGTIQGTNLFHSFQEFSIPTAGEAVFNHDTSIENIITRVTGGSASNIDGAIRSLVNGTVSDIGSANLFLINPNGIVLGPNATLDIGGSFMGSTAESVKFSDGAEFTVADPNPTLSINVPVGLQFGANPGNIRVEGSGNGLFLNPDFTVNQTGRPTGLSVQAGQTLALVGGEVALEGANLTAESGQIELGSVGEADVVTLNSISSGWSLDYSNIQNFQDIQLSQAASLNVSGNDAGAIQVQGRQVTLSDGSALLATTQVNGGGEIILQASELIQFSGISSLIPTAPFTPIPTSAYVEIAQGANGDGSSLVTVETNRLELTGGAQIGLSMAGSGSSGSVNIQADTVTADGGTETAFSGFFAGVLPVLSSPPATGQGADLTIEADRLQLTNGAQVLISTFGPGDAGNLTIRAQDVEVIGFNDQGPSLLASASEIPPAGSGGSVTIETARLLVADGGQISTGTSSFTSPAGDLTINASESIELQGVGTGGRSGLFASARFGQGSGGDIYIETDQLIIRDGATINASNFPSFTPGPPPGTGPAGNININAGSILLENQAILTAATVDGDRANINLQSDGIVLRQGSLITTNATGTATGGNINLDTGILVAFENSDITANSVNSFGGQVIVDAQAIFGTAFRPQLTSESDITASSELGAQFSGQVTLNTPEIDPSQGLVELPDGVVDPNTQVAAACERTNGNTFVSTGRGGLPENASQLLRGRTVWRDLRLAASGGQETGDRRQETGDRRQEIGDRAGETGKWEEPSPQHSTPDSNANSDSLIREAQGWTREANGQVRLVAQMLQSSTLRSLSGAHVCSR